MTFRFQAAAAALLVIGATAACSNSSTQPSSGSTASVTAPANVSPATTTKITYANQPVTLTIQNATATASGLTYTFEVATDPGFASKVQSPTNVSPGATGQTSVALNSLAGSTDYYWHARASAGGTNGPFSATYKFTIGPPITINAPVPLGPLNGAQTSTRPAFRVTNAVRTGPAGPITYRFEISTNASFTSIIVTGTSAEGASETGFIPTSDLPTKTTLYWHATAIDAVNSVTSAPSATQSFTPLPPSQAELVARQLGVPLWPGVQPPGTPGNATMGSDWTVEYLTSFDGTRFLNPPLDELQIFDLMDRGLGPDAAIAWMHANGYATAGAYYPSVQVIGFAYEYLALVNGRWDVVLKVGA